MRVVKIGEKMENKIRIFVVDDSKEVINEVKKYFSSHAEIEVVGYASDGKVALDYISQNYKFI